MANCRKELRLTRSRNIALGKVATPPTEMELIMSVTTERKRFVQKGAERLISLPSDKLEQLQQLRDYFGRARTQRERREIIDAVAELIWPPNDGTKAVNLELGIDKRARAKVDNYREQVGNAIRRRREKLNMTQEELAKLAGIPQSHVSRLEQGRHAPTHITVKRLAKALKTRPAKLDPGFD